MVNRDPDRCLIHFVQAISIFQHLIPTAVSTRGPCTVDIYQQIVLVISCHQHLMALLVARTSSQGFLVSQLPWTSNCGTVIYSSSAVPVISVPASVLDRKLLLPCYWFLRCNAPAPPVVTMNKAFFPLEMMFLSEFVTSPIASQNCRRITTVHCTGHQQAEKV